MQEKPRKKGGVSQSLALAYSIASGLTANWQAHNPTCLQAGRSSSRLIWRSCMVDEQRVVQNKYQKNWASQSSQFGLRRQCRHITARITHIFAMGHQTINKRCFTTADVLQPQQLSVYILQQTNRGAYCTVEKWPCIAESCTSFTTLSSVLPFPAWIHCKPSEWAGTTQWTMRNEYSSPENANNACTTAADSHSCVAQFTWALV